MANPIHPAASPHMPGFITAPGETDVLLAVMAVVLVVSVLAIGVFFFWLHSLPERMVHNKVQFDIVAVLALISLFTHMHSFWVAALIIALIPFPDFSFPEFSSSMKRIAGSLEKMADTEANTTAIRPPNLSNCPRPAATRASTGAEPCSS